MEAAGHGAAAGRHVSSGGAAPERPNFEMSPGGDKTDASSLQVRCRAAHFLYDTVCDTVVGPGVVTSTYGTSARASNPQASDREGTCGMYSIPPLRSCNCKHATSAHVHTKK